jgi:hypothetical protein
MVTKISFRLAFLSFVIIAIAIVAALPPAQADVVSHARIVRLSFVEGDVAYQSAGSDWQRAVVNLPIREGLSLRTDAGYAEVEFETGLVMQLAGNTQLEFTELNLTDGHKVTSLKLGQGTMIVTANLQKGDQTKITTGNGEVVVPHSGRLRIDSVQGQNWVTAFHGKVDVANGGNNTEIESGKTLHFGGAGLHDGGQNQSSLERSPRTDAFDKWASERQQALENAEIGADDFVRQRDYAFNTADLYNYGLWSNISGYGMAWQPYGMSANWMPFSNGMWMTNGLDADWMWASAEPWGWLPYHYGDWLFMDGEGWFWIPQNLGFFQGGNANFVNVGNQTGWTPIIANPVNPKKVRISPTTPTRVVFAGGGAKGVIVAGPRGVVPATTPVTIASHPAGTFVPQGGTTVSALSGAGVIVTSRGPVAQGNITRTYTAHGPASGTIGGPGGTGAPRSGGPGNLGGPVNGRPTAMAPHSSPVAVVRPPSTFASAGSSGRNSGVTPVTGSGIGTGHTGGASVGATGATTSSASNGSSGGAAGHSSGGTGSAGGTGQAAGASGKH